MRFQSIHNFFYTQKGEKDVHFKEERNRICSVLRKKEECCSRWYVHLLSSPLQTYQPRFFVVLSRRVASTSERFLVRDSFQMHTHIYLITHFIIQSLEWSIRFYFNLHIQTIQHSLYQSRTRSMQGERKADRSPRAQASQREGVRAYSSFGKEEIRRRRCSCSCQGRRICCADVRYQTVHREGNRQFLPKVYVSFVNHLQ